MIVAEYEILHKKLERLESFILLQKKHCESSETQTAIGHKAQESQTVAENLTDQNTKEPQVRNFLTVATTYFAFVLNMRLLPLTNILDQTTSKTAKYFFSNDWLS